MNILIRGGIGFGWFDYNFFGTSQNPRDKNLIELISGNPSLGDRISARGHWKENEYHIVLGFKGKPSRDDVRGAVADFESGFMAGFHQDEYHMDAIAHYDTNNTHVHIRICKENLRTGTQLQLYWHKKDVDRVNLIRDQINYKYDFDTSVDEKPLVDESKDMERIQKWRAERGQEPFVFDTKKNRDIAKKMIAKSIRSEHEEGNLDSMDDLRLFFAERYPQYNVVNEGYDKPKDFHYFTIQNKEGKKLRLDGEFYSDAFWTKTRELRLDQFRSNRKEPKPVGAKKDVSDELEKATQKRIKEVEAKYRKARARANQERGREEARARKYQLKMEKEKQTDELSRREDQAVRARVSTGEARESRGEERVRPSVAELVRDSFTIHSGASESSDRGASAKTHRERAVSHIAEIKELDEELTEAITIEADTERFGEEFEKSITSGFRGIKDSLNEWAGAYLEENRRRVAESFRRIKEQSERLGEQIERLGERIGKWIEDKPNEKNDVVAQAQARNAERRLHNKGGGTGAKPKPT